MTKNTDQIRALVLLIGLLVLGYFFSDWRGSRQIETSQKLPIETQTGSVLSGGSIPGQYPGGYTGSCTGCEVVSGVVLDSYYDIFMERVVEPIGR